MRADDGCADGGLAADRTRAPVSDRLQLRGSYQYVKDLVKGRLKKSSVEYDGMEYLRVLPPLPAGVPEVMLKATYSAPETFGPIPPGVTVEGLKDVERLISLRKNNMLDGRPG